MGIRKPNKNIGLWVTPEDAKQPENEQTVRKACGLTGRGQMPTTANKKCLSRNQASLGWQCGNLGPDHLENIVQEATILWKIRFREGSQQ